MSSKTPALAGAAPPLKKRKTGLCFTKNNGGATAIEPPSGAALDGQSRVQTDRQPAVAYYKTSSALPNAGGLFRAQPNADAGSRASAGRRLAMLATVAARERAIHITTPKRKRVQEGPPATVTLSSDSDEAGRSPEQKESEVASAEIQPPAGFHLEICKKDSKISMTHDLPVSFALGCLATLNRIEAKLMVIDESDEDEEADKDEDDVNDVKTI